MNIFSFQSYCHFYSEISIDFLSQLLFYDYLNMRNQAWNVQETKRYTARIKLIYIEGMRENNKKTLGHERA